MDTLALLVGLALRVERALNALDGLRKTSSVDDGKCDLICSNSAEEGSGANSARIVFGYSLSMDLEAEMGLQTRMMMSNSGYASVEVVGRDVYSVSSTGRGKRFNHGESM